MTTAVAAEPTTIQHAFEQAKAEHSDPTERALDAGTGTGASTDGTQTDESRAQTPSTDSASTETDLISDTELSALQDKHKDDPLALAKELKAVFTKKTQALAEQRKGVERLSKYSDFVDAIEAGGDTAQQAIAEAAKHFGLALTPKPTVADSAATTAATATDRAMETFKAKLGPDLAFLADSLGPAVKAVVEEVVKGTVTDATKPVQEAMTALLDKATAEQTDALIEGFTEKYPDWKQHEPAMLKIAESFQPGKDATPDAYMESLYFLATRDTSIASATKKAIEKMTTGASRDEGKQSTVSSDRVRVTPPTGATLQDAFKAAKAGQTWEGRR